MLEKPPPHDIHPFRTYPHILYMQTHSIWNDATSEENLDASVVKQLWQHNNACKYAAFLSPKAFIQPWQDLTRFLFDYSISMNLDLHSTCSLSGMYASSSISEGFCLSVVPRITCKVGKEKERERKREKEREGESDWEREKGRESSKRWNDFDVDICW